MGVYDLDHYIVMPSFSFDYTPETSVEFVTQKIHNANRISGKIKIKPSEFEQASAYVEEILESGPANFSWTSSSDIRYLDGIGVNVYGLFLACLCFFLLVVTVIVLFCRHQFSKHKAGMWYGVKKWKLFLHALMLIILSEITSAIVLLCFTLPILGALYLSPWSLLTSGAFALADGIGIIHLSACQQETTPCGDSLGNAV
jgi:hypothetical protein